MPIATDPDPACPFREVTDAEAVFPAWVSLWLEEIPPIPDAYWKRNSATTFAMIPMLHPDKVERMKMIPREGVDAEEAWKLILAILGTYSIKHETKEALVGWALESFFLCYWVDGEEDPPVRLE